MIPPDSPVLVGVGTSPEAGGAAAEAAVLMAEAARAAAHDATGSSARAAHLLRHVDQVAVPQGTAPYPDPGRLVAQAIGAEGARTTLAQLGVPQQTLVTQALRAVAAGRSELSLVVGGESRAWARHLERAGAPVPYTPQPGAVPDDTLTREPEFMAREEVEAGLAVPALQYAMIDAALGHAEGRTPRQLLQEISDLWARFSEVAAGNPDAAFGMPRTAADLATPGPDNFPLAFPYNKWHASQWTVDQAAALLVCSAAAARRFGVPPDRWIHPAVGLEASHAVTLTARRHLHRWPAMHVLGQAASAHLERPLNEMEVVEVYSCFPSAVRVQQRELDLDRHGVPTVTGGMAFAGGPFNHFTFQATRRVVQRLREDPTAMGMVTTVCGLLTKPGLAVWSATPARRPPLLADLAGEAARATETLPVVSTHQGPATVAAATVAAGRTIVVAGTPEGARCVASSDHPDVARLATTEGLVGREIAVDGSQFAA